MSYLNTLLIARAGAMTAIAELDKLIKQEQPKAPKAKRDISGLVARENVKANRKFAKMQNN